MTFLIYCAIVEFVTAAYGIWCAVSMLLYTLGHGEPMDHEWDSLGVLLGTFLSAFFSLPTMAYWGWSGWWFHIPLLLCLLRAGVIVVWRV